jgi:hypothetical protein
MALRSTTQENPQHSSYANDAMDTGAAGKSAMPASAGGVTIDGALT